MSYYFFFFLQEKTVKGTVYRITGSVPAGNFIQIPKASGQSLGLAGRYFYLLFKPIPSKHFVVHMDVATLDNLVVRISFSNLFKEFKSTSTWLQFPFVCTGQGTLPSYVADAARGEKVLFLSIIKTTNQETLRFEYKRHFEFSN